MRDLHLPLLRRAAASLPGAVTDAWPVEVENLLRVAVRGLGGGVLQQAAECSLGLAAGIRDRAAADRRRLAAEAYSLSVERFRKSQEAVVLQQVAEQICWIAGTAARPAGSAEATAAVLLAPRLQHRTLHVPLPGRVLDVTLHIHPAELLRDVDIVVSPSNTYFGLPEMYKASMSASLRRAGAVRDATGNVLEDPLYDGLLKWRRDHGVSGRPVNPGTIAPTASGALAERGIRGIYHAAVAVPRPGTNDYDVTPHDVATAAARALRLMSRESDSFAPPLRSICFPLLGAGRGGLPPETSISALWTALAADPDQSRQLHLVVRRPLVADLIVDVLGGPRAQGTGGVSPTVGEKRGTECV
ncbi:hypothetical protein ABZ759_26330 [Streptomyces sp. NPDC047860]|uniref:hypothetical protein n=1 Tax=Streptomyces sp. NPDC047860 TaxID=3155743 RepID=UPI003401AB30